MIEYLNGQIVELNPAHVVIDVNGIGYFVHISLNTYSALSGHKTTRLLIHELIREDLHALYGFHDFDERDLFRMLISVSGVGANTGILFLSSLTGNELKQAIVSGDVNKLKSVKGIGLKTAQRIIVELKDKLEKTPLTANIFATPNNTAREEALSALVTLGFVKKSAEKVIDKILSENPDQPVEQIIKVALKQM
ncbi:MAG TPA: Holliday junction branch migration protein RuvA [Prolixibacteraceae bacterium]|nr:Holliday junction branch migration protein RuvA [Prolixibacteraceae bacterium]HPR61056.1 Holliday junction branch migration protein RuvA [Prolixibacteraceae bacterium]